ncbi:OmpA family protein [Flavobacterium silvaticum]|uniref:OmpA family protein n=1 Tax=Flavobacterium silvaticum TaxID=1852020 RepID=A0A972JJ90_9FLAO|nr:OmpA family protein [Flavobacterium silvaticum]NMH27972.1 OmpA family protein [Flavobacterium silvaticum]
MSDANTFEKNAWLLPLVLLIGLVGLSVWFFNRNVEVREPVSFTDTISTVITAVSPESKPDTLRKTVVLPDGSSLPFSKGTMEFKLVEFLNDNSRAAGKDVWFDFDDVNFDLNSSNITTESQTQLLNIATIFKQYPKLKAKVGGYTDKSANEPANVKLSQERADALQKALLAFGVSDIQLAGAEGYGSQFASVPATASEEERRPDRRMSLGIREK